METTLEITLFWFAFTSRSTTRNDGTSGSGDGISNVDGSAIARLDLTVVSCGLGLVLGLVE